MPLIAVITTDLSNGFFGHARDLTQPLVPGSPHGMSPLVACIEKAHKLPHVQKVVLVHPEGQDPLAHWQQWQQSQSDNANKNTGNTAAVAAMAHPMVGQPWPFMQSARKWCLTGWRGGLGAATVFDEALPAAPILQAMQQHQAESAVLLRADWCLFDAALTEQLITRHIEAPDQLPIVFTQAAPGLCPVVVHDSALKKLAEHNVGFGQALGYQPKHAHGDPIGKDVCVPVPAHVRDAYQRFVYDTPEAQARVKHIAQSLGENWPKASADTVATAASGFGSDVDPGIAYKHAPWAQIEITPKRQLNGPIIPQTQIPAILDRPDMPLDLFKQVIAHIAQHQDVPVTLGGLGDPLCHPQWPAILEAALEAKPFGLCIETDLLCDEQTIDQLAQSNVDVVCVRLNADHPTTYADVNAQLGDNEQGQAWHKKAFANIQRLANARGPQPTPWIVPKLVKTAANTKDLESFYERWKSVLGHAVIERFDTGLDANGLPLIFDQSPVPMTPPKPVKWFTGMWCVLSNGLQAGHRSDWLGMHPLADQPFVDPATITANPTNAVYPTVCSNLPRLHTSTAATSEPN